MNPNGNPRPVSPEHQAEMIERYLGGEPARSIATSLGRTTGTVYIVLKRAGVPVRRKGTADRAYDKHPMWKGGRSVSKKGYVIVLLPPNHRYVGSASVDRKIPEHRLVMAEYLGRDLLSHENVHHKNGQRDDNRLENLELWTTMQPSGKRVEDLLSYAREILRLYA